MTWTMSVHYTCMYCFPLMLSVCYCLFIERWNTRSKIWFLFFKIRSRLGQVKICCHNFWMCYHFSDIPQHRVQMLCAHVLIEKIKDVLACFLYHQVSFTWTSTCIINTKQIKLNTRYDIPCFYFLNIMFTLHMHVHCTCTSINRRLMTVTVLNKKSQSLIIDNGPWCLQHLQE